MLDVQSSASSTQEEELCGDLAPYDVKWADSQAVSPSPSFSAHCHNVLCQRGYSQVQVHLEFLANLETATIIRSTRLSGPGHDVICKNRSEKRCEDQDFEFLTE